MSKISDNLDVINFRYLLHVIEYIKNRHHKGLKFHTNYEQSQIYKFFKEHNIASNHDSVITFSDSSWNLYGLNESKSPKGIDV